MQGFGFHIRRAVGSIVYFLSTSFVGNASRDVTVGELKNCEMNYKRVLKVALVY